MITVELWFRVPKMDLKAVLGIMNYLGPYMIFTFQLEHRP